MRKSVVSGLLLMLILLVGCLDYKAYDIPKSEQQTNSTLVDEIAAIEKQVSTENQVQDEIKNESPAAPSEKVLPELSEKTTGAATVSTIAVSTVAEDTAVTDVTATADAKNTNLETITVKENELVKLHVSVADPDKDSVTYTFSQPLDKNGQWKTNYGDASDYVVTITATDGKLSSEKKVKIVVQRVNVPPSIEKLKDITVKEAEKVEFKPKVTDPNKDKVVVTISDPLSKGTWQTDHTSAGEYQIAVKADDGELQTEDHFTLHVLDVNVPPSVTNVPEKITVKEGQSVEIKPIITDDDNDKLTVIINDPVGNDGVWQTSYTDHGTYLVTVSVSDGKDTVIKKVNIQVDDVNMPPQIVGVSLG